MKSITWLVESGPNASHLHNVKSFDRLMDARDHVNSLPEMPTGGDRPYNLIRRDWESNKDSIIESNI